MKQVKSVPPFYAAIKKNIPEMTEGVFTFKNVIYNPMGYTLTPDVIRHEMYHSEQQSEYQKGKNWIIRLPGTRAREWWDRFLQDPAFRLSQDLPAYQLQLWELEKVCSAKQMDEWRKLFAKDLNSKMYHKNGKPLIKVGDAIKAFKSDLLLNFNV
jgi:hypothetical protein